MGTTPDQQFDFNLTGPLSREQAEFIYSLGREAVIYALMILSVQKTSGGGESPVITPATPSGMIPV